MKILVIGLDGTAPELLLGDDRLSTIRSLMEIGCYGRLESVVPTDAGLAWMSLATGQDPGSLGVHGDRDRVDRPPAIWDQVAREGGRSILIGVPPGGWPATVEPLISRRPIEAQDLPTDDGHTLRDALLETSRAQFDIVREALENEPWDYFQLVESGLGRLRHALRRDDAAERLLGKPDGSFADVIRDYHLHLDEQLASILELLTEDTVVLVVSVQGAAGPDEHGAFVLASPQLAPIGEIDDAHLLDIAPTLLQLGGYAPLPDVQGKSLIEGRNPQPPADAGPPIDDDELVRERLRGLGYIG